MKCGHNVMNETFIVLQHLAKTLYVRGSRIGKETCIWVFPDLNAENKCVSINV